MCRNQTAVDTGGGAGVCTAGLGAPLTRAVCTVPPGGAASSHQGHVLLVHSERLWQETPISTVLMGQAQCEARWPCSHCGKAQAPSAAGLQQVSAARPSRPEPRPPASSPDSAVRPSHSSKLFR